MPLDQSPARPTYPWRLNMISFPYPFDTLHAPMLTLSLRVYVVVMGRGIAYLNQRGLSILEIILSTGLLIGLSWLGISVFKMTTNISKKTSAYESCEVLAKSLNSHLQKGTATSFVNNMGPDADGKFEAGIEDKEWKVDRFRVEGELVDLIPKKPISSEVDGLTIATPQDVESMTAGGGWKFNNYLNINNSINNMIALVNADQVDCIPGIMGSEPGRPVGRDVTARLQSWLPQEVLDQPDKTTVVTRMAVDVLQEGRTLCNSLPIKDINSVRTIANYVLQVDITDQVSGLRRCEARGTVNFTKDDSPPLTAVRIVGAGVKNAGLCAGAKKGVPSSCVGLAPPVVEFEVATFKDTPACRDCLAGAYTIASDGIWPITHAEAIKGTCDDPVDAITKCSAQCTPGDPGAVLFCRMGEKNWLAARTAGNFQDDWKPCHLADVYDFDGSKMVGVNVQTQYGSNKTGNPADTKYGGERTFDTSDLNTWAKIRLTGLKPERGYQFDVRVVDSAGKFVSPSFCGIPGNQACNPESGYGIAVATKDTNPNLSDTRTVNNTVTLPKNRPAGQMGFDIKLLEPFNTPVQCREANKGDFDLVSTNIGYAEGAVLKTPGGVTISSGMGIEKCNFSFTGPTGPVSGETCECNNNGTCISHGDTPAVSGTYTTDIQSSDECSSSFSPAGGGFSWCQDLDPVFDVSKGPTGFGNVRNPAQVDLAGGVVYPAAKKCGISYAKPTVDFASASGMKSYEYTGVVGYGAVPSLPLGVMNFDPRKHTGVISLQDNVNAFSDATDYTQACIQAMDPCGRYSQKPSKKLMWGLYLASVEDAGGPTDHIARNGNPGMYYNGNICAPGSYAGCNPAVGKFMCWDQNKCENFGKTCKSGWNETLINPSPSEACFDSKSDNAWATLTNAYKEGKAGERCSTTYTCVDSQNRLGSQQAGCAGELDSCTLTDRCDSPAPTAPVPAGYQCDAASPNVGASCSVNTDCTPGTCAMVTPAVASIPGACHRDGTTSCNSDADCDISDSNVKCQVSTPGTCSCPTNNVCDPPQPMGVDDYMAAPFAMGACDAIPKMQQASYCAADGHWTNWYCSWGDPLGAPPPAPTLPPADEISYGPVVGEPFTDPYGTQQICMGLSLKETCDPSVDGGRPISP